MNSLVPATHYTVKVYAMRDSAKSAATSTDFTTGRTPTHTHTVGHSKRITIWPNIHPFIPTFTHRSLCQPCKVTVSWLGAVRGRCLAQGHLDTLGGAGDPTSNLPVTIQPSLPPQPLLPQTYIIILSHSVIIVGLEVSKMEKEQSTSIIFHKIPQFIIFFPRSPWTLLSRTLWGRLRITVCVCF